jgi:release factor glutamine methyltransferase
MVPLLPDRSVYASVYEPREDSFLFLEALDADRELLLSRPRSLVLEVGPGSGIVSAHLSSLLGDEPTLFVGCDINPVAARVARETVRRNASAGGRRRHVCETLVGDLCGPVAARLRGQVDVLLFNPPYVPTDAEEVGHGDLRAAWAGGADGMAVTSRFLPQVAPLLAPGGLCYLVLVEENDPLRIARDMAERWQLAPRRVAKCTAKNERLSVWRFSHPK